MSTIRFTVPGRLRPPAVEGGKEPIGDCLLTPRRLPPTKMQIVLPVVVLVAVVGMIGVIISQPALRSGYGLLTLMLPVMMLFSYGGMFMNSRYVGADDRSLSPAALAEQRRQYFVDLDASRDRIQDDAQRQFDNYQFHYPEPALLRGLVGSARMWERTTGDANFGPHYLSVRVGTGVMPLAKQIVASPLGEPADYESASFDAQRSFLLANSELGGVGKALPLRHCPLLTLVGEDGEDTVYGVVRSMICQAALFHSPRDLKIMVVTGDVGRWDWVKWLPHNQHDTLVDSGGQARMVWTSSQQMQAVVGTQLHEERKTFGEAAPAEMPHWLVFNDQPRTDSEWDAITRKGSGGVAGVTFVRVLVQRGADGGGH